MINDVLERCDFPTIEPPLNGHIAGLETRNPRTIGQLISLVENYPDESVALDKAIARMATKASPPVLGITGTGGSGKSSLVDELVRRFLSSTRGRDSGSDLGRPLSPQEWGSPARRSDPDERNPRPGST